MERYQDVLGERSRQLIHVAGLILIIPIHTLPQMPALRILAFAAFVTLFLEWRYTKRAERVQALHRFVNTLPLLPETMREHVVDMVQQQSALEEEFFDRFMEQTGVRDEEEEQPFLASFTYLLGILFTYIFFGAHVAVLGILALSTGDAAATILGMRWGTHPIPWNREKTVTGSTAFLITAFLATLLFTTYFPRYTVLSTQFATAAVVAGVGAAAETVPTVDDNFSVPFIVGLVITFAVM